MKHLKVFVAATAIASLSAPVRTSIGAGGAGRSSDVLLNHIGQVCR
jgi:hypothetical protein